MKTKSIRQSLFERFTVILMTTFFCIILLIALISFSDTRKSLERTADYIRSTLIKQGLVLASNNSHALKEMVADNAFGAIQGLVADTVANHQDIVYGIYMDQYRQPWVFANPRYPDGVVEERVTLDDPFALWAGKIQKTAHRIGDYKDIAIYEFAAPVMLDEQREGTIRYGFSTHSMVSTLEQERQEAHLSTIKMLIVLFVVGAIAVAASLFATLQMAAKITLPLAKLTKASKHIAQGDYSQKIAIRSRSEIGELSHSFEKMRLGILEHRHKLELNNTDLEIAQTELRDLNQNLEQKVRERTKELEQLQAQLVEAARAAGMAEVAVNVLHNIGNVINSVNVASQHSADMLQSSKLPLLQQTLSLLQAHQNDITAFCTQDPKGRLIPQLLQKLGDVLAVENQALITDNSRMQRNIELIKSIIATQQQYAKADNFEECFDMGQVLRETTELMSDSLNRYHIQLQLELQDVPPVRGERAKLHQVINNLMSNAKEALRVTPVSQRKFSFSLYEKNNWVVLDAIDNGEGIAPDRLTHIFQHGYTTKTNGHGFGLHSCANYIGEMGGYIEAFSEGKGKGCLLRISLPSV
ncbi:sensor histidine kinase [Candidatus Venteria ishoeyi]|uniref:histidine kinase n=1 Tax=Candidatus Venteria ishoeyi TaxID=1899563 RepID=A0A1H6FDU6_9GAMM|nr:sensor histidine kinase [Candidatus Venteria ishoeyi]MDM8547093.1 ATP-binding protein [Candidatus Venteria ishoeyi]SEH08238.1 Sensor histidine kinase TmoS [Candidatus Venteria ishoeyi]